LLYCKTDASSSAVLEQATQIGFDIEEINSSGEVIIKRKKLSWVCIMELPEFQRICLGSDSLKMCLEDLCECEEDEKPGNDISNKSYRYAAHRIYTKQSGSGDEDNRLCETCTSYRVVLFSPFERDIQIRTTHILYFIISFVLNMPSIVKAALLPYGKIKSQAFLGPNYFPKDYEC